MEDYLWHAFVQYFGCYSPVIHQTRTQWTTGVGERGNRKRRDIVRNMRGNTLHKYLPAVIKYTEQQWTQLVPQLQATSSVRTKTVNKSVYKKGYESLTLREAQVCESFAYSVSALANAVNNKISNKDVVFSLKMHDTNNILTKRWADTTFENKISAIRSRSSWCPGSENSTTENAFCDIILSWCKKADMVADTESAYKFLGWNFQPSRKRRKLNVKTSFDNECNQNTNNKQM